jgi:hypothetical protein
MRRPVRVRVSTEYLSTLLFECSGYVGYTSSEIRIHFTFPWLEIYKLTPSEAPGTHSAKQDLAATADRNMQMLSGQSPKS